jgi:hypothetical protein
MSAEFNECRQATECVIQWCEKGTSRGQDACGVLEAPSEGPKSFEGDALLFEDSLGFF